MTVRSLVLGMTVLLATAQGNAAEEGQVPPLPKPSAYTDHYLSDRTQIVDVINAVGSFADQRRWNLVKESFADEVVLDYSSSDTAAAGRSVNTLTRDEIIAAWESQLPGYLHTQHAIANHLVHVDGDRARVYSLVHATHYLPNDQGDDFWVFVGSYEHELTRTPDGWKIARMRAQKLFDLGNKDLPNLASARVKAGQIATGP